LLKKLKVRDPKKYEQVKSLNKITTHPLFEVRDGEIEDWEIL
jgi:hypothetical protein